MSGITEAGVASAESLRPAYVPSPPQCTPLSSSTLPKCHARRVMRAPHPLPPFATGIKKDAAAFEINLTAAQVFQRLAPSPAALL